MGDTTENKVDLWDQTSTSRLLFIWVLLKTEFGNMYHLFVVLHRYRHRGLVNFLMISLRAAVLQISNLSARDAVYVT